MKAKNLLKKAFLLLALMGGASSAWADTTYKITYNGSDAGNTNYFGYSGNHNFNPKFNGCTYDGTSFTSGLKMENGSTITFTTANTATVTVVQSTWSNKGIKLDNTSIANSTASTTTGAYIYTISNVAAGSHTIVRDGGELGIFQVTVVEAAGTKPTITTQPASATYVVDASPAALTVEASASAGDLSYQWYKNTDQDKTAKEADKIAGATSATLEAANISTAAVGTTYYYVVVTDGNGSTTSDLATITVLTGIAPDVSAAISTSAVRAGTTVTLTATVNAGTPAPTLQWYTCDSDGSNESPIDGATNTTYQPSTASTGTYYFKVKAHNDSGDDYSDVVTLTVIAQGVSGAVGDLETISSNYTFIADNHTGNGVVGFTSGYLYDESRIFSPNGNNASTSKGSSTIDGNTYYNSLRVKSNSQDILAFKVGGACYITFYAETTGKNPARPIKVGNDVDDGSYGTISDANEDHIVYIPSAGTVYLTGNSDRFIAGFKVTFTVSKTITPAGWASFSSSYPLDLSTISGGTAYYASAAGGETVTLTPTGDVSVPAGEGIMVKGTADDVFTIKVAANGTAIDGNLLKGQTTTGSVAASTDATKHYVFGYVTETPTTYGFYNLTSATPVDAGKAYLETTGNLARALRISLGGITEVENVEAAPVATVKKNGAYLENGKIAIYKNGMKFNANGQLIK